MPPLVHTIALTLYSLRHNNVLEQLAQSQRSRTRHRMLRQRTCHRPAVNVSALSLCAISLSSIALPLCSSGLIDMHLQHLTNSTLSHSALR
jgi:hypothetical protein